MTLTGRATGEGTGRFSARRPAASGHFRTVLGLSLSSIGLGTYLGSADAAADGGYAGAVERALQLPCNVLDTAVNYRGQRSERVVGRCLATAVGAGEVARDEVLVATKGGFLTPDSERSGSLREQVEELLIGPGVITADDIVAGCHCMTPAYLRHQLGVSLANLGLETIDVYYLHNPETQLQEVPRPEFEHRVRDAFSALEEAVAAGRIGVYGTATWSGYREPPESAGHLSLGRLLELAAEVGGAGHHFRAVQLPVSLAMPEALASATQRSGDRLLPLLDADAAAGMVVMASGSLLQGRLVHAALEPGLADSLGAALTPAQRALQFARSAPGVATALVGMSRRGHVEENLALAAVAPLPPDW